MQLEQNASFAEMEIKHQFKHFILIECLNYNVSGKCFKLQKDYVNCRNSKLLCFNRSVGSRMHFDKIALVLKTQHNKTYANICQN